MREDQEAALFGDGGEALDRQGFGSVEEHAYIDIPKSHASSASVRCEEDQAREDEAETAASGGAEVTCMSGGHRGIGRTVCSCDRRF